MMLRLMMVLVLSLGIAMAAAEDANTTAEKPEITTTRTRGGATFPSHVEVGEQWLPLRGADLLKWWMWNVYSAALYVPETATSPEQMLAADTPRRLVLKYHRSVKIADIVRATEEGLAKDKKLDRSKIAKDLERLYACYTDVGDGDVYTITYRDGTTTIALNNVEACTFEGEEFARAYFGIWISNTPLDKGLARALRGEK